MPYCFLVSARAVFLELLLGLFIGLWLWEPTIALHLVQKLLLFLFPGTVPPSWPFLVISTKSFSSPKLVGLQQHQLLAILIVFSSLARSLQILALAPKGYRCSFDIPKAVFQGGSLFGCVVSVGDGDGFRFYHLPFFALTKPRTLSGTLSVRLAGVDAPESAHFGRPGQPYSAEAKAWLTDQLCGRFATIYPHRLDQYGRVVASVYCGWGPFRKNISLKLAEAGLGEVYTKGGAEYKDYYWKLLSAVEEARKKKKGMWAQEDYMSPGEYKKKNFSLFAIKRSSAGCI